MMLRGGDLNLNRSVQSFGDSTMERLKQAMLQHELMFRNQVCELHRLYWTQKDLMNELRIKGMDTDATSSYSWLCKESEEKKNTLSMSSGAEEARNVGALEELKGNSAYLLKSHQREFSLHLSADEFHSSKAKDPAFYHKAINFRSKEVFDLESSVIKVEFHEETNDQVFSGGFSAQMQNSSGVFGTQAKVPSALISSSITGNYLSRRDSLIHLSEENGGQLQEQKPPLFYAGVGDSCIDASFNQPLKKQQTKPVLFDLNLPHEDESSHDLKALLEQEEGNSFPTETSFVAKPPLSDPPTKISCENETSDLIFHGEDSTSNCSLDSKLDLNTSDDKNDTSSGCQIQAECCEGSTDSSDQCSLSINVFSPSSMDLCKQIKDDVDIKGQDSNITSSNSINLPQTVIKDSVTKPTNHEGSEEDTSSSHAVARDEIAPSIKFLTECNSHRITRNNESSNTDDSVTTQLNSSQNERFLIGKLKPEEWDTTIVSAAKALMSIPFGCSTVPIEQPRDIDTSNLPQYSSDSFERTTLQLSEVQSEDRRATTEPSNANKTEKNERAVRLRRGRGFRDFQKEVLPGLVTLSRHEICEDLHNIGYKLRRVSSRNVGENWFVPVRSRRSKLCSERRRRLSSP